MNKGIQHLYEFGRNQAWTTAGVIRETVYMCDKTGRKANFNKQGSHLQNKTKPKLAQIQNYKPQNRCWIQSKPDQFKEKAAERDIISTGQRIKPTEAFILLYFVFLAASL